MISEPRPREGLVLRFARPYQLIAVSSGRGDPGLRRGQHHDVSAETASIREYEEGLVQQARKNCGH